MGETDINVVKITGEKTEGFMMESSFEQHQIVWQSLQDQGITRMITLARINETNDGKYSNE
jgi:hypothetical protein